MSTSNALLRLFAGALYLVTLIGCATGPMPAPAPQTYGASGDSQLVPEPILHPGAEKTGNNTRRSTDPGARGGLATTFGEALDSEIDYADFKRGFLAKPYAVGVLYYNSEDGARAMANHIGGAVPLEGNLVTTARGVVDWGLKSPKSGYLGGYLADGKVILTGEEDDRYSIILKNNTRQPLEFVVSVDGLDVMDGEPAAYSKRGYIVGPKRTMEVKGFRTSTSKVAAFRFGRVPDSYAVLRHGDARNVGVIGVAVFSKGAKSPWARPKGRPQREEANPFPAQRFAIPPY